MNNSNYELAEHLKEYYNSSICFYYQPNDYYNQDDIIKDIGRANNSNNESEPKTREKTKDNKK